MPCHAISRALDLLRAPYRIGNGMHAWTPASQLLLCRIPLPHGAHETTREAVVRVTLEARNKPCIN
ncbi:hypothetical protein BS78_01G130300 [Paspalum vaginatum]|nr:hypothetical protein BS78_01G130300 [Paspalum vaginatum]